MDCPEHLPGAVPTLGDPTANHASSEARGRAAAEAVAGDGGVLEKLKSGIWNHFDKMPDSHSNKMVKCRYCPKQHVCSSSSTEDMWRGTSERCTPRASGLSGQLG